MKIKIILKLCWNFVWSRAANIKNNNRDTRSWFKKQNKQTKISRIDHIKSNNEVKKTINSKTI